MVFKLFKKIFIGDQLSNKIFYKKYSKNVLKCVTAINIAWVTHLDLFLMKEHKIQEPKKTVKRDGNK